MLIHEITKGKQQVTEGILDDLKAAVTATKTGYKQGGLAGVAKNLTSRTAYNQALQQNQRADTNKEIDKLEKKWGTKIKRPLSYYADQLQNPTKPEFKQQAQVATQQRQQLEPQFTQTFAPEGPGDVLPDPGQVLSVELNKGKYYKTAGGKWYNEVGQQLPTSSYANLEKLIDQDRYSQVPIPASLPGGKPVDTKGVKSTKKVDKVAPAGQTQEPDLTGLDELKEARTQAQPGSVARRAQSRNAGVATPAVQPSTRTPTPAKKTRANLKTDFGAWIASKLGTDYKTIIDTSPQIKSELTKIFTSMVNQKDMNTMKQLFNKYVLTAQAALLKARVEGGIGDQDTEPSFDDELSQLRGEPAKKTGNQKLDQLLNKAGIQLTESQVAITKDIRVKTPKGDYVKSAKDQQWYDPNGILISADKYADFVKRLDATPAAQNAYQAEMLKGSGSDSAYIKSQVDAQVKAKLDAAAKEAAEQAAAAHPPPPPPQATAADYAAYQAEKMRINNQMLQQTKDDLLYAEWFNTGQQDYLQKQFAALIGTK